MSGSTSVITDLLARAQQGDASAAEQILPLVYDDLRRMAQHYLFRERQGGSAFTLQATALVHEAYLRLLQGKDVTWSGRRHFFAAAALAMRRILVERARRKAGPKAGGGRQIGSLVTDAPVPGEPAGADEAEPDWELLDRAMQALSRQDAELAEVVHLRYFAGLSVDSAALALETSPRTVDRRWQLARAWLLDWSARNGDNSRLLK